MLRQKWFLMGSKPKVQISETRINNSNNINFYLLHKFSNNNNMRSFFRQNKPEVKLLMMENSSMILLMMIMIISINPLSRQQQQQKLQHLRQQWRNKEIIHHLNLEFSNNKEVERQHQRHQLTAVTKSKILVTIFLKEQQLNNKNS